ncbi:MAG: protein kinase domain-containing protein [Cyanobacteriota bacterium]
MEGHTLGGRYRLSQKLGSGSFGQTYLAQDSHRPDQPWVVVKHLRPRSGDPEVLRIARCLFQREVEILEQLGSHDRIPRLLGYFEEETGFYLVQEWIEGETLEQLLQSGSPWPEANVRTLLEDVLQTLAFVHQQGVIHRNLKPANLIRRQTDGHWVLIDFGAVKQVTLVPPAPTEPSQGCSDHAMGIGSPGYIPSEQLGGNPCLSSDLYALGLIALQALSGIPPQKLFHDPLTGELRWHDFASVSAPLSAFLDRMVCYDWRQRFPSAVEALEALQALSELALPSASTEILPNAAPAAWDPLQEPTTPPRCRPSLRARLQLPPAWLGGVLAASAVLTFAGLWQIRSGFGSFPSLNSQTASVQERSTLGFPASGEMAGRIPSPETNRLALSPVRWANALELQATLEGSAAVTALAISPDGNLLASGEDDGLVKLWDLRTGERLQTLVGHTGSIETLAISPDGIFLVSAGADRTVRVWDLSRLSTDKNGTEPLPESEPDSGTQFLRLQLQGHQELINSVAISPDSRWIASGSADRTIRIWQADSGQLIHTVNATAHESNVETGVTSVTFGRSRISPTRGTARSDASEEPIPLAPSAVILAAAHADPTIHLWDPIRGTLLDTLEADYPVEQVLLSQDGRYLLGGSAHGISIWNLSTGSVERKLPQNFASLATLSLSPDGRLIAGGTDHRTKEIKLWDLRTGELLRTLSGHTWTVSALLFSPDGQMLFSGGVDGSIRIWGPELAEDEP